MQETTVVIYTELEVERARGEFDEYREWIFDA